MLQKGIELFNQKRFFKAHEVWEKLWLNAKEDKKFLQGLIFISGGYHHYLNSNKEGCILFLERGIEYLSKFKNNKKINVKRLIKDVKETIININYEFNMPKIYLR